MDSADDCFSDDYYSDDSFNDSFCSPLDTDPFASPLGSDPFSTPSQSDPFASPLDSPAASFHSAPENPHPQTNPFSETPFNLVNYSFTCLNPNHHALSSGSDALSGHCDPDATQSVPPVPLLIGLGPILNDWLGTLPVRPHRDPACGHNRDTQLAVSHTTFNDPHHREEPARHPIATDGMGSASAAGTDGMGSASAAGTDDGGWDRLSSAFGGSSGMASGSEWEQWEVRDVTPRESFPLQRLDPLKSTLYRRRVLERDYGVEEGVVERVGEDEDCAVTGRDKFDVDGQPRASVSGKGLPVVVETGATGTSKRRVLERDYGVEEGVVERVGEDEDCAVTGRDKFDVDGQPRASVSGKGLPVVVETGATGTSKRVTGFLGGKAKAKVE
ncbi:hypothetical protein F5144DRAFT_630730 [Chaetomium tenue]|uniref:Uncharacterized protein n=1 Tax=Chaetomium tenue TaxID=1854479 RepID=A0ACB7P4Z9_9PEZI|nr:hypothetical protein F5144DRAFT_630730 [Chaetomium globosum]